MAQSAFRSHISPFVLSESRSLGGLVRSERLDLQTKLSASVRCETSGNGPSLRDPGPGLTWGGTGSIVRLWGSAYPSVDASYGSSVVHVHQESCDTRMSTRCQPTGFLVIGPCLRRTFEKGASAGPVKRARGCKSFR